jgi:hypothetical protein
MVTTPSEIPVQSRAFPGGGAGWRWWRKNAGCTPLYSSTSGFSSFVGVLPVCGSRTLDLLGQIWCALPVLLHSMVLHRQEQEAGKGVTNISLNKVRGYGAILVLLCILVWPFLPCRRGAKGGRGSGGCWSQVG